MDCVFLDFSFSATWAGAGCKGAKFIESRFLSYLQVWARVSLVRVFEKGEKSLLDFKILDTSPKGSV